MKTLVYLASFTAVLGLAALPVLAQHEQHHAEPGKKETQSELLQKCRMMQGEMEQMQSKMQEKHQQIQTLVDKMNAASGEAKINAIANTVTAMNQQHQEMYRMHAQMMQNMMSHMGEHMMQMMQGPEPEARQEMMQCPMMKSMHEGMGNGAQGDKEGSESKEGSDGK